MKEEFAIRKTLEINAFSNIEIDQVFNYLETLDYDLENTRYIGKIVSKNERLAKYFFLRDQLKLDANYLEETFHIYEILDQCVDWSEFWRLLVIKKGFCCISLLGELERKKQFSFFTGPNILSSSSADFCESIYEDIDY